LPSQDCPSGPDWETDPVLKIDPVQAIVLGWETAPDGPTDPVDPVSRA
jgi:hypothetical protein